MYIRVTSTLQLQLVWHNKQVEVAHTLDPQVMPSFLDGLYSYRVSSVAHIRRDVRVLD